MLVRIGPRSFLRRLWSAMVLSARFPRCPKCGLSVTREFDGLPERAMICIGRCADRCVRLTMAQRDGDYAAPNIRSTPIPMPIPGPGVERKLKGFW